MHVFETKYGGEQTQQNSKTVGHQEKPTHHHTATTEDTKAVTPTQGRKYKDTDTDEKIKNNNPHKK